MRDATPEQPEGRAETLELINIEIAASLARQSDSGTKIDTKAVVLVGYAAAASSFLATQHAQPILAVIAYVAFGAAAGFGIWSYAVRLYHNVPEPRRLFNGYMARSKAETLAALAATRVEAFESNIPSYERKARRWWISLASLAAGVILMILAVVGAYW